MRRWMRVIAAVLLVLVIQMSKPAPARATDGAQIALYVGIGVAVLGTFIYIGTRLTYPEEIHMLVPGAPPSSPSQGQSSRIHFAQQCHLSPANSDSLPLLCW